MPSTTPEPTRKDRREQARRARQEAEAAQRAREAKRKRLIQLGAVLAVAAIVVAIVIGVTGGGDDGAGGGGGSADVSAPAESAVRGIPQDGIFLGNRNAPVRLVEFADMQCPFCAQFATGVLPQIINDYVRTGRVRMELRTMAFIGEDSTTAARAAAGAAQQDKLYNFTEVFFENQGSENSGYVTPDFLDGVYRAAGVDAAAANAFAQTPASETPITEAEALAQRYSVESTPSFLVGRRGGGLARVEARANDEQTIRRALDGLLRGS